jgi:hypothetical protein
MATAVRRRRTEGRKHHPPVQLSDASLHVGSASGILAARGLDQLDERASLKIVENSSNAILITIFYFYGI